MVQGEKERFFRIEKVSFDDLKYVIEVLLLLDISRSWW